MAVPNTVAVIVIGHGSLIDAFLLFLFHLTHPLIQAVVYP